MADGSPHRHMKSYDDEWVHKPLTRINHLSADSIHFALNLRSDEKNSLPSPVESRLKVQGKVSRGRKGKCELAQCVKDSNEIKRIRTKNKLILAQMKEKEKELAEEDEEYAVVHTEYEEIMRVSAEVNTTMYELKREERLKDYPAQIRKNKKTRVELNHEIDLRKKTLLALKRDETRRALPHGALFSQEEAPSFTFDGEEIIFDNKKQRDQQGTESDLNSQGSFKSHEVGEGDEGGQKKSTDSRFYHSGTFIRNARTGWEPAWTCCMASSQSAKGCHCRPSVASPRYTQFVKSKSVKYIKTVDMWAKSRHQERPGVRDFRQWSSPTLKPSPTLKVFELNRLKKSKSCTHMGPPKPLF